MGQATLFLMVGLPGSGKTTRAKELERETGAIRFTPDEWHLFLFGDDFHDAQGVSVILDFGFWAKEQREEKFREAQALGAGFAICYVHAPLEELCRRLEHRVQAGRKDVFQAISREDMERWAALFQPPDAGELRGEYGPG